MRTAIGELLYKPRSYRDYDVYRSQQFSTLMLAVFSPMLVVMPITAVLGAFGLLEDRPVGHRIEDVLLSMLLWVGVLLLVDRVTRGGVYVRGDTFVIRNQFRTVTLQRDEIRCFKELPYGGSTAGYVEFKDGRRIQILSIWSQRKRFFPHSRWATDPVAALNALLDDLPYGTPVDLSRRSHRQ